METLTLVPINASADTDSGIPNDPSFTALLEQQRNFYQRVGFDQPWIGYLARLKGQFIGAAGFKGKPRDGKVEIAYHIFPEFQQQGLGTMVCRELVQMALKTDVTVRITARTLPENNPSTRILTRNGFDFSGTARDDDDGIDVWEWEYDKNFTFTG
ncbi:MAG: GNAT family N-acetyltransferase [Flavobacteriales bacterium]